MELTSLIFRKIKAWLANEQARWLVKLMLICICIFTCTGFLGPWGWLLDLTSHFRLQYLVIQVLFMGLFIFIKRPIWLASMLLFALINGLQILPFYYSPSVSVQKASSESLTKPIHILHLNVFRFHLDRQRVLRYIDKARPDFLSMAEFDKNWIQATENSKTLKAFSYQQVDPESRLALFSRYPLDKVDLIPLSTKSKEGRWDALIVARFKIEKTPVSLILMHPKPPLWPSLIQRQNAHFDALKKIKSTLPRHQILVGDFNMTSWSESFKTLTNETGLQDTRLGRGLQVSWPTHSPLMMLPIDHCLVSDGFRILSRKTGESVGSDHLPLHIRLALNKL